MRIGGEAPRRRTHSRNRCQTPWPASGDRHLGSSSEIDDALFVNLRELIASGFSSQAARKTKPAGTSPVVTKRHRAMSNLRARATIMVFRFLPSVSILVRYHWANALSFWKSRKRQASWISPRRTRALPALASPFSRRLLPLSSGEPDAQPRRFPRRQDWTPRS